MTRIYLMFVVLFALALTACSSAPSGAAPVASPSSGAVTNMAANGNDEQALLQLGREATQAMIKNDHTWIERTFDEKAIYTGGDGTVLTKPQLIELFKARDWHYESANTEDVKVQLFGDTAIMTGWGSQKASYKGTPVNGKTRFTHTVIKRQGQWQIIAGAESGLIPAK